MANEEKYSDETIRAKQLDQLMFGALAGGGFVALIQLSSVTQISSQLMFAVYCFSIAIPLNIGAFVGRYELLTRGATTSKKEMLLLFISFAAILPAFLGIAAIFFHFSNVAGWVFCLTSIAILAIIFRLVHAP